MTARFDSAAACANVAFPPCRPPVVQYAAGDEQLQALIDDCLAREGVLLALARYSKLERARPPPSLRCVFPPPLLPHMLLSCIGRCALLVLLLALPPTAHLVSGVLAPDQLLCATNPRPAPPSRCRSPPQGGHHRGPHARRPAKGGGRNQGIRQAGAGLRQLGRRQLVLG